MESRTNPTASRFRHNLLTAQLSLSVWISTMPVDQFLPHKGHNNETFFQHFCMAVIHSTSNLHITQHILISIRSLERKRRPDLGRTHFCLDANYLTYTAACIREWRFHKWPGEHKKCLRMKWGMGSIFRGRRSLIFQQKWKACGRRGWKGWMDHHSTTVDGT